MNGFIIDHESVYLILKELDPLGVEQGAQHCLSRCDYVSAGSNHTWYIDEYDKLNHLDLLSMVQVNYSQKILWFLGG